MGSRLWHIFECLTTAGLLLQHGELEPNPLASWTPIIHRDMKIENVFVSAAHESRYKGYPMLKMADFGHAIFIAPDDARHPTDFNVAGTPGCFAPEQSCRPILPETEFRMMNEKKTVWGVGHTIWEMIMVDVDKDPEYKITFNDANVMEPRFYPDGRVARIYSPELLDLVLQCTIYNPDDRPMFKEMMQIIKRCTGAGPSGAPDRAIGLRKADKRSARYLAHALPVAWQNSTGIDKFAIDMNFGGLKLNLIDSEKVSTDIQRFDGPSALGKVLDDEDGEVGSVPGKEITVPSALELYGGIGLEAAGMQTGGGDDGRVSRRRRIRSGPAGSGARREAGMLKRKVSGGRLPGHTQVSRKRLRSR